MKKLLTVAIISLIAFACSHKTSTQTTPKESSATVTHEQWLQGKVIYEASCQRCHTLKNPSNYTMDQWTTWVSEMAPKAKISEEQKAQIVAFGSVNVKAN